MEKMVLLRSSSRKKMVLLCLASCAIVFVLFNMFPCDNEPQFYMVPKERTKYVYDIDKNAIPYDKFMPLIFVGGMPRSGTTLMRALLDAHPDIRCGEETRIIPRILGMRTQWERSPTEKKRLSEAGITSEVMDSAVQNFILEIIAKHGTAAKHLCNKDPFTLKSTIYLSHLFPNAKFLFMVRDGRAVVNSIITRKVTISGFDLKNHKKCLLRWNQAVDLMYSQCVRVGQNQCMPVYYEQLVLHPEVWMHRILNFLQIPWNESVLHHQDYVGKPGGISLSRTEKSTDQVIKPVNIEALSKWVGQFPEDVVQEMDSIAPMLKVLGYDPNGNPPDYGTPDPQVRDNTLHIQKNINFWKQRERDIFDKKTFNDSKSQEANKPGLEGT